MSVELRVPSIGESITQATIGTWLKKEGEPVKADEPVVEVESEKATVALPAPVSGVLAKVLKQPGDTVNVGEVIGLLDEGAVAAAGPGANPAPRAGAPAAGSAAPAPKPPAPPAAAPSPAPAPAAAHPAHRPPLPPSARRLLAENGLTADAFQGGAALRKEDLRRALERGPAPAPAAPPVAGDRERVVAMTPLRRTVARRLVEAQHTAAILTTFNEADLSRVMALREKHQPAFTERHGVKLGFMSFFVKAAVEALRAFPAVNAEVRGESILYKDHYDIGVAVGGGKGLVVPVVRDADRLSFAEVELAIAGLSKKARENRISMEDLQGGTFTISNGGIYGSLLSTPILNPPQSGILGLHKIEPRAVVRDGQVVVRPMMFLALSYDHRLVDGREAVSFLVRVKECIEDPERLLLEV
ncbi:MAG TPA: 2-oxoglutarate dehydrogenase complex dihydrolipoyllysine-residue succinyltransferase [Anaeromyxobacteraceae bacterium]|jgi:2-oxoglutarate dehydrogenase E2 component (dihydrolipoamide succinyltransferase)|nr:2-oxoglutarate dehydrogenase complex dihydrolipoyllysine-residue succinyltransferase [Anaeromyxobacteraceae bacterium]